MDPLTPLAVTAAAQSVKPLTRGVRQLGNFASVLAGTMAEGLKTAGEEAVPAAAEQTDQLRREAIEVIDRLLRNSGVSPNPPLEFNVQADGQLRLADDHPRAAEIEAMLNRDGSLQTLVAQLSSLENSEIQLVWPAANLTKTALPPYTMGSQRTFGG